jgi:hypothetical protein
VAKPAQKNGGSGEARSKRAVAGLIGLFMATGTRLACQYDNQSPDPYLTQHNLRRSKPKPTCRSQISKRISPMKKCLLTICSGLLLSTGMASASAEDVWFAPPDNMDRGARTFNHDFPQPFEPLPAWDGKTDGFVLSPKFAADASEEDIKRVISWLAGRHIALAVGAGAVQTDNAQRVDGECGYGVEGYTRPNTRSFSVA